MIYLFGIENSSQGKTFMEFFMNRIITKTKIIFVAIILCVGASSFIEIATGAENSVEFQVTSVSYGGKYANKNSGVIWVEDAQNNFVKTLKIWASKRKKHLVKWNGVSGGNTVDAVSGASAKSHGTHTAIWNCTNVNGAIVSDGKYKVYVEYTEDNSQGGKPGKFTMVEFTKGGPSQTMTPPDENYFVNMKLVYTGGNTTPTPASLSGTVKDVTSNTPISNATVQLKNGNQVAYETTTNNTGDYSIQNIQAGTYLLVTAKSGYLPAEESITLNAGQSVTGENISLSPQQVNGSLSGKIRNANTNNPVATAVIQLLNGNQVSYEVTSNASGNYSFQNVQAGTYSLRVSKGGYETTEKNVSLAAGQSITGRDIILTPVSTSGSLSGTIRDANTNNPVATAVVQLLNGNQVSYEVTSNASGNYSFQNVQAGTYNLRVSKDGYETTEKDVSLAAGQSITGRDIILTPVSTSGSLSGTIRDANTNNLVATAAVQLLNGNQVAYETTSNASGNYSFQNVQAGPYRLRVSKGGYETTEENASLAAGQSITGRDVILTPIPGGSSLSGTVVKAGTNNPIASAAVQLLVGCQVKYETTTGASGNFNLTGLDAGIYALVTLKNGNMIFSESVTIISGQQVTGKKITLQKNVSSTSSDGMMTFEVETKTYDGKYADKNAGVIWVEDAQNNFVKTLKLWASKRKEHLIKWNPVSRGNTVDAVTGASEKSHKTHSVTWNCTDVNGNIVNDGSYKVYVEFTEDNSSDSDKPAGKFMMIEFTKDSKNQTITPQDENYFEGIKLVYTSDSTPAASASLNGLVKDAISQTPLANVVIQLNDCNQVAYEITTNAFGEYFIQNIQQGIYLLTVSKSGYSSFEETLITNAGQAITNKEILLKKIDTSASLSGTVLNWNSDIPLQNVVVQLKIGNQIQYETTTDPSGNYTFNNVQIDTYTLYAVKSGYAEWTESIAMTSGNNISGKKLRLQKNETGASLSGTVQDLDSNVPIKNASVQLKIGNQIKYEAQTNTNGSFLFASVDAGTYTLTTIKNGYEQKSETVTLNSGDNITTPKIILKRTSTVDTTPPAPPIGLNGEQLRN